MSDREKHIQDRLAVIPSNPGVYQYFDEKGTIIYIGKAKDLRKRVMSYFSKQQTGKLRVLVRRIADIKFIVVDSEYDALLLENNLIKKYQPRYNVLLKDDKSFPWICIKKEHFPRIFPTRNIIHDGSEYFGPYASVKMMNTLLDLIRHLYTIRSCNLRLKPEYIAEGKFKLCLEYHIGNCKAPCEGMQTEADYLAMIKEIREIIRGNIQMVIRQMKSQMMAYADEMAFEKAQLLKEKVELLEKYRSKSTIVSASVHDVDVFSMLDADTSVYVNYLKVAEGAVVQSHSVEIKRKLEESAEDLLTLAITDIRERLASDSKEIIVPFEPSFIPEGIKITTPHKGDKKHLLDLSERNAKHFKLETEKKRSLIDPERHQKRVLNQLMKDLRLPAPPTIIECFDNSNFQGDYAVAAMVQFENAKPNKKNYRHFNIKTVEGPDDFASMEEIVHRRYHRLLMEEKPLPQLIVVDGGKGQLSAAVKSLDKLGLRGKIAIIGIAKRLEEIYFPGDSTPLYIDKRSESLKIIQQLRDEAHRFGITHHRKQFEKGIIKSELTSITGVGDNTAQKLLWEFKSVKKVKEASLDQLKKAVGESKAQIVFRHYHRIDIEN